MRLSVPQLTHGLGQGRNCKVSPWQKGSEGAVTVPGLFRAGIAQGKKKIAKMISLTAEPSALLGVILGLL